MDSETLNLRVDVEVRLSPILRDIDVEKLVKGAVSAAFKTAEDYLGKYLVIPSNQILNSRGISKADTPPLPSKC